jgi:hypothetical protein
MAKDKDADLANFTLPSDPKERKKIRDILYEMSGITQAIKDRREDLKSYAEVLNTTYNIPKKVIPKVAKIVFDHNFEDVASEHSAIELLYEGIMETNNPSGQVDKDEQEESES